MRRHLVPVFLTVTSCHNPLRASRNASRCVLKTVSSLDRSWAPIPSRGSQDGPTLLLTLSTASQNAYSTLGAIRHSGYTSGYQWKAQRSMSTISTLSAYLLEQKKRFLEENGDKWTIVMGNEAGDLDSLASAIAFAWFLSHEPTTDTRAIALITTAREDFVLRAENLYALQLAGIKNDFLELLCSEDIPKPNPCTSFALVDHNSLDAAYALPGAQVTAVIDHHEDEGKYLNTACPRIVEPAGSCGSLVARVIMSYPTLQIPPELATLLLSAIVIDTGGLRKGGKAVGVDYQTSAWLLPQANVSLQSPVAQTETTPQDVPDNPWIQSLSTTLNAKKTAVHHLGTRDLLRRDYKEYTLTLSSSISGASGCTIKAGLATVPLPLSTFASPSPTQVVAATQDWIKERGLSVLGVLTTYKSKKGKHKREAMWVVDENVYGSKLPDALFDGFEASEILQVKRDKLKRYGFCGHAGRDGSEDEAERGSVEDESDEGQDGVREVSPFGAGLVVRVYRQKNLAATRKQVTPLLRQILEG